MTAGWDLGLGARAAAALACVLGLVLAGTAGAPPARAGGPPAAELAAPARDDLAGRVEVAALPRATAVNDRDGNKLFDDLDARFASTSGRERVIVTFTSEITTEAGVTALRAVAPGALVDRRFTIIPAFSGWMSRAEALAAAALPEVRQIEHDRPGTPELATATTVMGADAVVDGMGIDGSLDGDPQTATTSDVGIAILDTGFHTGHVDLAGKLVAWRDFGTSRVTPYDPDGHGTHVASIAAGWGRSHLDNRGVASGASVIGIKIDGGGSTSSNAIAGYDWIVANKDSLGVRVATISFGFGTATDGTTALELAVDRAWNAGIVCFKSNGNSGPGLGTMTVPAAARGILATGSLLDPFGAGSGATKHGFVLSDYSSRGPTSDGRIKPDITAPGESIVAAQAGSTTGMTSKSGTSMASPFAAGTAALMIAANPALQPDDVRALMFASAEDRGAPGPDNDFGHGRIRVWDAVAAALASRGAAVPGGTPPLEPRQESRVATPAAGVYETTFNVTSTDFPVAVTVLGDTYVHAVTVLDSSGIPRGSSTGMQNGADRQHHLSFIPSATGTHTLRVVSTPGARVVMDISHSSKPQ